MRKSLLFAAILIVISSALCANPTSTTASMQVSAYKDQAIDATVSNTFTIKYFDNTAITGIVQSKDISDQIDAENLSLASAFSITISSNSRNNMTMDLQFSPFVNQSNPTDSDKSIPLSYAIGTTTTRTRGSSKVSSYYYAYLPSLTLSKSSPVSVSKTGNTVTITYNPTATVYRNRNSSTVMSTTTQYTGTLPSTTGNLPGFSNTDAIVSSVVFNLLLNSSDYENMLFFVDYVATVAITITMN